MAKPRIFVSSTYYDLKHIRNSLDAFVTSLGYEPVLFESGDIPFRHDQPIDDSCYAEIGTCHMLVLIIGSRYGSHVSSEGPVTEAREARVENDAFFQHYNSITRREYETARKRGIPIFIFVEKNVLAEYQTYKVNRENKSIRYAHVQNINVFRLLDDILIQRQNNFIREFDHFDDISAWLRDQWAGLFADALTRRTGEVALHDLASQIHNLAQVSNVLKEYSESIIRKIEPKESKRIISTQRKRLRAAQLERFAREPLISFVSSKYEKKIETIVKAIESSNTLEEFLGNIGLTDEQIKEFVAEHEGYARGHLTETKQRYFSGDDEASSGGEEIDFKEP